MSTTKEIGNRYGKLIVISRASNKDYKKCVRARWNCICLCINCHNSFHNKFGRGKNNRHQLGVFLGGVV